jgi:uncharacterized membrane-anchored protein
MRFVFARLVCVLVLLISVALPNDIASAQTSQSGASPLSRIHWAAGPVVGRLGDAAEVRVPASCRFTGAEGTKQYLEATENPPSGNELGLLSCQSVGRDSSDWFVVFSFDSTGLVKDDEKTSLDQATILKTIQRGTDEGNQERRQRGWVEIEVLGWQRPPYYDAVTHNLTWSTRLVAKNSTSGKETINHSVRLLGRSGVMNADLVAGQLQTQVAVATFDTILKDYSFLPGSRYSEWRAGDKIAEYGLTALIAGGAGVAAAKLGLFGKLWKLILVVVLAVKKLVIVVVLGIAGFFKKLFSKRKDPPDASGQP